MKRREAILKLRKRIKDLGAAQVVAKRWRKQKQREAHPAQYVAWAKEHSIREWFYIQMHVWEQKALITAALNYLHEIRGSEPCHGIRKAFAWIYPRQNEIIRKEFVLDEEKIEQTA